MFLLSNDYWEVKKTKNKGKGVFAKKDIPAGTIIGDYLGKLLLDKDFDESTQGLYDMYFNDTTSIVPDKNTVGIHLINHSCCPNCQLYPYQGHVLFFACRYIFTGEELTIDYFLDLPGKSHLCNHTCYCDTPLCRGTMHCTVEKNKQMENLFYNNNGKYMRKPPVPLGKILPLLQEYPEKISDNSVYDLYGCFTQKPLIMIEKEIPAINVLRKIIRKNGRILYFTSLSLYVWGIKDKIIVGVKDMANNL